ncbi:MAG: hypothetical protein K2I96_22775 [Lachnospiraceae bacterium]|nr:hypothetical protein [Lachnospiraceae bacterium]
MFNDIDDIVKLYSKNPETATVETACRTAAGEAGIVQITKLTIWNSDKT